MNKHIALDQKLNALRQGDAHRKWSSLDDWRLCILCGKVISGRMVDVWQDRRGSFHFHCPTLGCEGKTADWFYHTGSERAKVQRLRAA